MENEEQKPVEEVVDQVAENVEAPVEKPVDDRPEINYKMELERRKQAEERLRQELELEKSRQVKRYDPNDISTWGDQELYALKNSQDPNHLQYRQKAEDLLFERKMERALERQRQQDKRANAERELLSKYPQIHDPEFAAQMEQVMFDLDLQKSPAGRLAAARIVAAEHSKGSSKANAAGRKQEEARLKDVKQTLAEGDRPDPRANIPNPNKQDDLIKRINNPKGSHEDQARAMADLLRSKGIL